MSRHTEQRESIPASEVRLREPRILLAEADNQTRQEIAAALRNDGYNVLESTNGFELLDQLRTPLLLSERAEWPAAIIMGAWLPGISGIPILEGLRSVDLTMPIVLISGTFRREHRYKYEQLGADAIFEKPFEMYDLRTVVLNMVPTAMRRGTLRPAAQAEPTAA